ncbi:alpha/beta hydrolase [Patescibacteria group bacterium]|nr:alpha/beta hydrolase [Patescibacteria group bacterium]
MTIKGLKINYKTLGEGKPLLILHGWGSRSDNWQRVGELLAQKGIKVIIPDLPGFGRSQKPSIAWGLDEYCEFLQELVEFLNLERFYLLGHSFGGALAVKYSLKFPEKIEKLFLVNAACFRRKTPKKRFLYILSKIFPSCFLSSSLLRRAFYRFIVKSDYPSVNGLMKEIYLKIIKQDLSDILSQVQVSTTIIWGEKDNITPIKDAHLINKKIKDSKLEIISNVNHDLNLKNPEELSKTIIKNL